MPKIIVTAEEAFRIVVALNQAYIDVNDSPDMLPFLRTTIRNTFGHLRRAAYCHELSVEFKTEIGPNAVDNFDVNTFQLKSGVQVTVHYKKRSSCRYVRRVLEESQTLPLFSPDDLEVCHELPAYLQLLVLGKKQLEAALLVSPQGSGTSIDPIDLISLASTYRPKLQKRNVPKVKAVRIIAKND